MPVYHDLTTAESRKHFNEMVMQMILAGKKPVVCFQEPENHRTQAQSNAMWLWAEMVAMYLNDAGLDQRAVIREDVSIDWSKTAFIEQIWRPVQKAMTGHESTKKPGKTQFPEIYETICRHFAQKFGLTLPEWPHREGI